MDSDPQNRLEIVQDVFCWINFVWSEISSIAIAGIFLWFLIKASSKIFFKVVMTLL